MSTHVAQVLIKYSYGDLGLTIRNSGGHVKSIFMHNDWNDELDILSAENVQFTVEAAGLGSRLGAVTIDLTLQGLVLLGLAYAAAAVADYVLPFLAGFEKWGEAIITALKVLVPFAITIGYGFFFEWLWDGQTPGKRWLGLRVMQTSGMPITVWEAMVRNVLRLVDFLPVVYGLGALVAIINGQNRRIGDLVAGTIVARERHDATKSKILDIDAAADAFLAATTNHVMPNALAAAAASPTPQLRTVFNSAPPTAQPVVSQTPATPIASTPIGATPHGALSQASTSVSVAQADSTRAQHSRPLLDAQTQALMENLSRLSEADIELLHEFMARRERLKGPARVRLAQGLAVRLSAQLGQAAPARANVEPWLEMLARALHHARAAAP